MSAAFGRFLQFFVSRFAGRTDRGATAVEYGLLVAGIALAIVVVVGLVGGELNALFVRVQGAL